MESLVVLMKRTNQVRKVIGTTLVVENGKIKDLLVQELAKENTSNVPPRYITIQPQNEDNLAISEVDRVHLEIPVIDMQRLIYEESENSELAKLHLACKDWGFFQLVNHGVRPCLVEKVKLETQEFFNLPMSEKRKFWQTAEHIEGFGQAFVVSEEQKLDWADIFYMITLPQHMRLPHLFPHLPLPFRDTLENYSKELKNLAMTITNQMGKALNMEEMEMAEMFEDGVQAVRMNYYPPCPQPDKVIGLTPHSDTVALTILLQVSEVEGLQVRKDGKWVPVKPLPNAFIINIGDQLEIITNGIYRSIEHRATVNSEKERISIATFYNSRHDGVVGPTSSLVTEETPARFKTVTMQEYLRGLFSRKLDGKSYLGVMRIEHQD